MFDKLISTWWVEKICMLPNVSKVANVTFNNFKILNYLNWELSDGF